MSQHKPTGPAQQPTPIAEQPTAEHPEVATQPVQAATDPTRRTAEQPALTPPRAPLLGRRPVRRRRPRAAVVAATAAGIAALVAAAAFAKPALLGHPTASPSATVLPQDAGAAEPTATTTPLGATSRQGQQATPAPRSASVQNVQLVGKGFSALPVTPGDDPKVTYAVLLRNPRGDQLAADVRAIITFTGPGGVALKVKDEQLDALLPGQTGAIADDTDAAGVTGMRVQLLVGRWLPARQLGLAGQLLAGNVRTGVVAGKLTTSATIRSTLTRPLGKAEAVAVWSDRSGRILGGHSDGVDLLAAGGTVPVVIDTSHAPRGIATTRVYATPSELFDDGD